MWKNVSVSPQALCRISKHSIAVFQSVVEKVGLPKMLDTMVLPINRIQQAVVTMFASLITSDTRLTRVIHDKVVKRCDVLEDFWQHCKSTYRAEPVGLVPLNQCVGNASAVCFTGLLPSDHATAGKPFCCDSWQGIPCPAGDHQEQPGHVAGMLPKQTCDVRGAWQSPTGPRQSRQPESDGVPEEMPGTLHQHTGGYGAKANKFVSIH